MSAVTHLSYLGFQLFSPAPILKPYIRNYWLVARETPLVMPQEEFLHPEGGFGIIFNFGDNFAFDGQIIKKKYLLDGANSMSRRMQFHGKVYALGLRFHVAGAYPFLQMPLHKLVDEFLLLDTLELNYIDVLYDCLAQADDINSKIHLLDRWFIGQLLKNKNDLSPIIPPSLHQIHHKHGKKSLKTIADDLYISQRQMERIFKTQIGISPKQYGRLQRVGQARHLLKQAPDDSSVRVGNILGYYDQSHFIREFKAIVGMTPYQYQQRKLNQG